jgi:hypothetical protein
MHPVRIRSYEIQETHPEPTHPEPWRQHLRKPSKTKSLESAPHGGTSVPPKGGHSIPCGLKVGPRGSRYSIHPSDTTRSQVPRAASPSNTSGHVHRASASCDSLDRPVRESPCRGNRIPGYRGYGSRPAFSTTTFGRSPKRHPAGNIPPSSVLSEYIVPSIPGHAK